MKITLWGTRGSIPVSGPAFFRHGGSTTCVEVEVAAGGGAPSRVVIDCGTGLAELGKARHGVFGDALLLQTHLHWDHIQGFPFFGGLFDPSASFDVRAVRRDERTMREVLEEQMSRPTFPVGLDVLPADLSFRDLDAVGEARVGELTLRWTELCHPSGSTAWRLEQHGNAFVFTGDVEVQEGCNERLIDFARGADVMVMDAQYFPEEYETRRGWGHSTPVDAVETACAAGVGRLILTHHDPSHDDDRLDAKLALARKAAAGRVLVDNAYDRMEVQLKSPLSTHAIR